MSILDQIVAKARGEAPAKPEGFQLEPPREIMPCQACGARALYRTPVDREWSCLACRLRVEPPMPDIIVQKRDGWQVCSHE
jgi:hypothetical protein